MSIEETIHQCPGDRQPREEKSCVARALARLHVGCPASSHLFIRVSPANHSCALPQKAFPDQHSYSQCTNHLSLSHAVAANTPDSRWLRTTTAHFSLRLNLSCWPAEALTHGIFFLRSRLKDPSPSLGCDVLSTAEGKEQW